jgi:hypothetical protein
LAKGNITRLNDVLNSIPDLATAYPAQFRNLNKDWLRKQLFKALEKDPYFDVDEISEDISLGGVRIIKLSSETRLRELKRFILLVHRILGYHSSQQTRLYKQQIRNLDENKTLAELTLQLSRGVKLATDSLHDWLIKTTADDGGALVHYYNHRLNEIDITEDGWCLGVSTQWVRFQALGRTDFWKWMWTPEGAGAIRFIMAAQGVRSSMGGVDWSSRAAFALRRFGVIQEGDLECNSPETATPEAMARNILAGPHRLRRIGQLYVGGGGHAMAAINSPSVTFMDPNAGEIRFTSGAALISWLPKFCRRIRYEFRRHYVEQYSYQPNLARNDEPKPESMEDVVRNAMHQRRRAMGY